MDPVQEASPTSRALVYPYAALMLVAATLVSMFDSPSLSLTTSILARLTSSFTSISQVQLFDRTVGTLLQLGVLVVTLLIFYIIGRKVDFAARSLHYTAIVFAGAFIGAAVSYNYLSALAGGSGWETGFGYVWSFGVGDANSFLSILTAAAGSFMIPVAGLCLSSLKQGPAGGLVQPDGALQRLSYRTFFVGGFVIAALALPISAAVYQVLGYRSDGTSLMAGGLDPWRSLIAGYAGFLVYPGLLIPTFYFLGRGRSLGWKDVPRFSVGIFVAGVTGLLIGIILNIGTEEPGGLSRIFSQSNLSSLPSALLVGGAFFASVGIASASLGTLRRAPEAPWSRKGLVPIGVSVALVAIVVIGGMASYSYALSPYLGESKYTCAYQPGAALYLKVVSDQSQSPLHGLSVTGELTSTCPVVTTCTGQGLSLPICPSAPITIRTLGTWSFVTNSSGYVAVPQQLLGGSGFQFDLTYQGHAYQTQFPICGGGVTFAKLDLPSGSTSGTEVPGIGGNGQVAQVAANGTQVLEGCTPVSFSGNATMS